MNEYTFAFYNRLRGMIVPDDKINRAARISSILGNLFGVGSSVAGASTPFILRNMNKNIGLPSRSSHMYSVSPDFY